MGKSKTPKSPPPPQPPTWAQPLWNQLIVRWAVGLGTATALLSLVRDAPLGLACTRGVLSLLSALALGRLGGHLLEWSGGSESADSVSEDPGIEAQG